MMDFQGKVLVISGAAGNLGAAVVKKALEKGAVVCGLDHGSGRLKGLRAFVKNTGALYEFDEVDVTDREVMVGLQAAVHEKAGRVDILVNTVGGFTAGEEVHELALETWERMLLLNVFSFLNLSHAFVPDLLAKGQGKAVSVGSRAALKGGAKTGAYAGAKGALLRLTESMAEELKSENIQVNCVLPGTIDTPQNREGMPNADFSNWVTPEQVADVILYLCSSAADGITGAAVPVYGQA